MEFVQTRLKEARKMQGLTQIEISEKLGMKQATYQKLESGKTPDMRISTLCHICKTLNISANWLLGIEDESFAYTTEEFHAFYMSVIDLIQTLGEEELISDEAVAELMVGVDQIKSRIG